MEPRIYCPSCRREIPDMPAVCSHCGCDLSETVLMVDCLECGRMNSVILSHCEHCGTALEGSKRAEYYLEHDPQIAAMNDKYAKCGLIRLASNIGLVASVLALILWAEYDWADIFCYFGVLGFPVFGVTSLVCGIRRKVMNKKIRQALADKR